MDGWDRPEDCIGPETNCSMVRVCSHGFISSSHAFTSDWRAEDMDCIIPSIRDLIYLSWMMGLFVIKRRNPDVYKKKNRNGPWDHSTRLGFLLRFVDHISNI